jgi:hypothetical protein
MADNPFDMDMVASNLPGLVTIPAGQFWLGASPTDLLALEIEKPGREMYLAESMSGRTPPRMKMCYA